MAEKETQTETIDQDDDSAPFDNSQTDKSVEEKVSEEALKASEDFDKKLDEEGVADEETKPSDDDKKGDEKNTADKTSDEKNTADEEAKAQAEAKTAKEEEEQEQEQKADDDDDSVLSDDLLTRAVHSGLNLEEAKSFNSAKALETTLGHIERASQSKDNTENKDEGNKDEDTGYKPFELKPYELKFEKEDEIDPDILTAIKGMNDHNKAQMEAMNAHNAEQFKGMTTQMQTVQGSVSSQASLDFEKNFDSMVKAVEADFVAEFGKGTGRSLGKDSAQMANRMKVINTMQVINKTYTNDTLPPEQEVFNQAVAIVFADKAKELATKKTVSKLTKRGKQAIGKPSGQKGDVSPDDKAVEISKEFDAKIDSEESSEA